jgi:DNA-binding transcriptional ArsR family regulator
MQMDILDDRALNYVADYFRALAEPLRLKIVNALRSGEHNVGDLTDICGCSQANVSKHLSLLLKAGLIKREARGTSVYYSIADGCIYDLCDLVCGQLARHFSEQATLHAAFSATEGGRKKSSAKKRSTKKTSA